MSDSPIGSGDPKVASLVHSSQVDGDGGHELQQVSMKETSTSNYSASRNRTNSSASQEMRDFILMTPYPVEPGHTLITMTRVNEVEWKPEMRNNAAHIAEGDNAGIIINKPSSIMDYNRAQAAQKERQQPPNAKMSFKVFLINSETNKLTLEHRTLRFWLNQSTLLNNNNGPNDDGDNDLEDEHSRSTRSFASIRQESSQLAQAYFCQLIGTKPDDDFPKNYVGFIMKLMRLLKGQQFSKIVRVEVELRQLAHEEHAKPPSRLSSIDEGQGGESNGRVSPLTSQKILDIIESSYPNPISIKEICSTTQADESIVKKLVDELATKEKINSTDDGKHFTRTTKTIDTKINLVKHMPKVVKAQQPVIAIITAQYCEKLAVDSMISDKETFVRYRVQDGTNSGCGAGSELSSANYVYTLGNIGDHRVVSTKLTSVGHSRGALIAAGNATTRLLGTFPEIEYVFLVGCGGGVANYTDFDSHVRLGDVVVSHLPSAGCQDGIGGGPLRQVDPNSSAYQYYGRKKLNPSDYVYVHCKPKQSQQQQQQQHQAVNREGNIPASYSVHKNLKRTVTNGGTGSSGGSDTSSPAPADEGTAVSGNGRSTGGNCDEQSASSGAAVTQQQQQLINKPLEYNECQFKLWRPAKLDLQELTQRLWMQGLENPKHRIWQYYIEEGIKTLKQQDIDSARPKAESDKLFMSIGSNDTIEVNHPEAGEGDIDLRRDGWPMCHFGPIGSGTPALANEPLKQQMISEFGLRAFDSEFDPVIESIYGNCKESYVVIRGISDYKDGRKKKDWQQYSALVAAAFMKSVIVNLKPLD